MKEKCKDCKRYWSINAKEGACCVLGNSLETVVKADTCCEMFEKKEARRICG